MTHRLAVLTVASLFTLSLGVGATLAHRRVFGAGVAPLPARRRRYVTNPQGWYRSRRPVMARGRQFLAGRAGGLRQARG